MLLPFLHDSKDDSVEKKVEKKTVTVKYRLLVNPETNYQIIGSDGGGIQELYLYIEKEMSAVSDLYNKESWTITETAETEEAAIAACDKKAIAVFDEQLSAINAATESIKVKFDAKKAELLSKITVQSSKFYLIYKDYGGHLYKGKDKKDELPREVVKEGTLLNFQAIGGEK